MADRPMTMTIVLLAAGPVLGGQGPLDTARLESPILASPVQLTGGERFLKAGEQYFSPDMEWIIFQAVPAPVEGEEATDLYSMYVAKVTRGVEGGITGIEAPIRISPPGSANTCGWFHPTEKGRVMWGSTLVAPKTEQENEFAVQKEGQSERARSRYKWTFFEEMDVVEAVVPQILGLPPAPITPTRVFERPNYDAECSWSSDGRFVLYVHVREEMTGGRPDADIWVYDTIAGTHTELVSADGYDGGPFFSPDGLSICYRSDRNLDDHLQIFISDLAFDSEGGIEGIEREYQVTSNGHVNWAPFWHPSGEFLVYASSELGHFNYEIMAVETNMPAIRAGADPGEYRRVRITYADGADVLPVFSPDGRFMIWTAQRGEAGVRHSTQVWAARTTPAMGDGSIFRRASEEEVIREARAAAERRGAAWAEVAKALVERTAIDWTVTLTGGGESLRVTLTGDGRVISVEGR